MKATQFFEIKKERQEYLGVRFFKWTPLNGEIVQVCFGKGEPKRGRSDNFGVYHISQMTFFSNYLAMGYAVPCTKEKFEKAFKLVFDSLRGGGN
jgi:hypothetical protein